MTKTQEIEPYSGRSAQGVHARREDDLAWFANAARSLAAAATRTSVDPVTSLLGGMRAAHALRSEYLPPACRSDTDWALVAALLLATIERRRVPMSSLGLAAGIPYTTALNHVRRLIRHGQFRAVPDAHDRRRTYIELSPELAAQAEAYLQRIIDAGRQNGHSPDRA